jgi:hypothetical protein
MKDIDTLVKLGDVNNSPLTQDPNSNLNRAWTNALHGFPVGGQQALLDEIQFKTGGPARLGRKAPQVIQTGANEVQGFHSQEYISLLIKHQRGLTQRL